MRRLAAAALLVLGLAQMTGDLTGIAALKALGAATGASPAPRVFSAVQGLETYSTRFWLEWTAETGAEHRALLDSERYQRLRGPYNRRNVYGAALAYGPVLVASPATRPMFEAVASAALCGDAPLARELGLVPPPRPGSVRVRLEPLPGSDLGGLPRLLQPRCTR
ncbi:MAG TPA: hypothetical protein VFX28_12560 [Methylomirabilota bacterium]|nr:hypothetical protein [Methylomirabilota bacterium]